jgi:hypothetical protein
MLGYTLEQEIDASRRVASTLNSTSGERELSQITETVNLDVSLMRTELGRLDEPHSVLK